MKKEDILFYTGNITLPVTFSDKLSWRENIEISFDAGQTKHSLHRDKEALKKAVRKGIISYSCKPYSDGFLFIETIMAEDEVSPEVLDFLYKESKWRRIRINLAGMMSLVNHPSVLKWLLEKGVKCQHVFGYGKSTMENFLNKLKWNEPYAEEMMDMLKEYNALDISYLESITEKV